MTARASTPEHVCSSCRSLVLRGEAAAAPSCSRCGRVVCSACELGGLCGACVSALWTPPVDASADDRVPIVVGGCSLPGRRPDVAAPTFTGGSH